MTEQKSALVQFRAGDITGELNDRGPTPSATAKRDLERYYYLLGQCLGEVQFNFAEALVLAEALEDVPLDWRTIQFLGPIVEKTFQFGSSIALHIANELEISVIYDDKLDDSTKEKFGFVKEKFQSKLDALNICQTFAIYDAIEQYHLLKQKYINRPEAERKLGGKMLAMMLRWSHLWNGPWGDPKLEEYEWYQTVSHLAMERNRDELEQKQNSDS